jgi:hypothetical protein
METRGHTGICRTASRFGSEWLRDVAETIQSEHEARFTPFGATLRVRAIKVSHLLEVGDGLQLDLDPDDAGHWPFWGDFEADLEVRRRPRLMRNWREIYNREDVMNWARKRLDSYVAQLEAADAAVT